MGVTLSDTHSTGSRKKMAENAAVAAPEAKAKGGGKKKLILIVAAAALLLVGGGGAGYYFLMKKPAEKAASAAQTGEHKEGKAEEDATPPATLTLDIFTANVQPVDAEKYLQVGLVLKIKSGKEGGGADAFKPYVPDIRNAVIAKMAELKADDVAGFEKREVLRAEFKKAISTVLPAAMQKQLLDVLYTQFVMQ